MRHHIRLHMEPKIHLRDTTTKEETYSRSPHISSAIHEGLFTVCRIITNRITLDVHEVTCHRCQGLIKGLTWEGRTEDMVNVEPGVPIVKGDRLLGVGTVALPLPGQDKVQVCHT